jgi:hypothetical protein
VQRDRTVQAILHVFHLSSNQTAATAKAEAAYFALSMESDTHKRLLGTDLFRLFVAVFLATGVGLPACLSAQQAGPAVGASIAATNLAMLLHLIEAAHAEDIERDRLGKLGFVRLRQGWANDRNVTLVSAADSLRRLTLEPTHAVQPTQIGIAALTNLSNLVTLHVACSGPMEDGVFRAICNLNHLRTLRLTAAYPLRPSEYNSITNLQDLAELHVTYCTNFGDTQLALITNLPRLRSLELRADALSRQATNLLSGMRALTNVVVKPTGR